MELSNISQKGITVISLNGDVMGGPEAIKLIDEINHLLDNGLLKVILNLELVNRMNSSGIGILVKALTTYKKNGGELKLANTTPLVKNLLVITKLIEIFDLYDSVDDAIASFAA